MPITISLALNVTPLVDNEIAFANAAAWNAYFNNLSGTAELDPIDVAGYTAVAYDYDLTPHSLTVDSMNFIIPTLDQHNSLVNQVAAMASSYATLRGELYAAGLIDEP